MIRLIRSGHRPTPQQVMAQRRHRDHVAASWRPCPVFEALAAAADADRAELDRRNREAIRRDHEAQEAMLAAWHEADMEAAHQRAMAARAARLPRA